MSAPRRLWPNFAMDSSFIVYPRVRVLHGGTTTAWRTTRSCWCSCDGGGSLRGLADTLRSHDARHLSLLSRAHGKLSHAHGNRGRTGASSAMGAGIVDNEGDGFSRFRDKRRSWRRALARKTTRPVKGPASPCDMHGVKNEKTRSEGHTPTLRLGPKRD